MIARPARSDAGFTLPELIIVVLIIGVITVPLGNFLISYFVNTNTTAGRMSESHDEQIMASYFSQDVAAAGTRNSTGVLQPYAWTKPFPGGSCGSSVQSANQVLLLQSDDVQYVGGAATTIIDSVAYVIATSASGERQLHRLFCTGAGGSLSQRSDIVVAHNLNPAQDPACVGACAGTPATIDMSVAVKNRSGSGDPYAFTVSGTRRQAS